MVESDPKGLTTKVLEDADIDPSHFSKYLKTALTRARILTNTDFDNLGGVVQTLHGPAPFKPGDYLAEDVKSTLYPISARTMADTKALEGEPDADGWGNYRTTTPVEAARIDTAFAISLSDGTLSVGKPGDYYVRRGDRRFIVDAEVFTITYKSMPTDENTLNS